MRVTVDKVVREGLPEEVPFEQRLRCVKGQVMPRSVGRVFKTARIASAKSLRQE